MKSTLSSVVIVCLVASPLAGCATTGGPRQIEEVPPDGGSPTSNWSRVGQLRPAAEIALTTRILQQGSRYFVAADDRALIVLNLTEPTLPAKATRALRDMAAQHPESFVTMQKTGALSQNDVRIGRDGLFVADRRIADFGVVPGLGGVSPGVAWLWLIGSVATGGYLGSHWSSHETEGLVYQAP